MELHDIDANLANASVKWGMGGGSLTSVFGYLSSSDILMIAGVVTTALGFLVNLYFQYKRDVRSKEEHELTKELLKAQIKHEQEAQ